MPDFGSIPATKTIALIAHDSKKKQIAEWAAANRQTLEKHVLCGTKSTAALLEKTLGLPVLAYSSGPLGGDIEIAAKIVEGQIGLVVFLWDPLESQPHDPDIRALLRIAVVYDIPIATNTATADFLLASSLMGTSYEHRTMSVPPSPQL